MGYGNEDVFLSPEEREALIQRYLGKTVEIQIDRPIGHVHVTKGITLNYTINYGFLPGVTGGDGEEQDVYLLGVDTPVEACRARIIAAIRRKDDNEDKFVAAPEGMEFHQAQIAEAVHFVEKYFDSRVDSLIRRACGVIPFRKTEEGVQYLLLLQTNGFWSFPKGHMEAFETEAETALRELNEETGLKGTLVPGFRELVSYPMENGRTKQVVVFPGTVTGAVNLQKAEAVDCRWVSAQEAKQLLHANFGTVLDQIHGVLEEYNA